MNALAAAAAAHAAGAGLDAIAGGLAAMRPVAGRLQTRAGAGRRATDRRLLQREPGLGACRPRCHSRRCRASAGWCSARCASSAGRIARLHAEIGELAQQTGVERLLAVGDDAASRGRGLRRRARTWFAGVDDLVAAAESALHPGVTVLVKGSRSNRLERVARRARTGAAPRAGEPLACCATSPNGSTQYYTGFNVVQLPHAAGDPGGADGAVDLVPGRPVDDPQARRAPGRPARPLRRAADATCRRRARRPWAAR